MVELSLAEKLICRHLPTPLRFEFSFCNLYAARRILLHAPKKIFSRTSDGLRGRKFSRTSDELRGGKFSRAGGELRGRKFFTDERRTARRKIFHGRAANFAAENFSRTSGELRGGKFSRGAKRKIPADFDGEILLEVSISRR